MLRRRTLARLGTTIFSGPQSLSRTGSRCFKPHLWVRQQHLAVAHDQPRLQPDAAFEGRHHGEVEFVGEHHVGEQAAVAFDDVQPHIRIARRELFQRRRQRGARHGRHQPDAQVAGHHGGEAANLLVRAFELADRLDAALVVALACRRRGHAAAGALEELQSQGAFGRGDMLRDAGLGGVLARCGAGERAFLVDRNDRPGSGAAKCRPCGPLEKMMTEWQNILIRLPARAWLESPEIAVQARSDS